MMNTKIDTSELRVGDYIRITGLPNLGNCKPYLHPETQEMYEYLVKRDLPVMITEIDEDGCPWYDFLYYRDGVKEHHSMIVKKEDRNWDYVGEEE